MLTQNGFQVGSLCEMVLLSLALASRVNEMQQQSRTDSLLALAESLRKTVEDAGLSDGRITISIGVASPNDQAIHTVGKLFRAADTALYQDKAEGRNRVVRFAG